MLLALPLLLLLLCMLLALSPSCCFRPSSTTARILSPIRLKAITKQKVHSGPFSRKVLSRKMTSLSAPSLTLTPEEEELFSTLRQVVKDENLGTVIRVAGGWVRDRMIGYEGKHDIDLALDNMLGSQMAKTLVEWNEKKGFTPLHYHVVQLNPEKSKHLETATMKLGKFDVDFVNLRSESYSDDSRIPDMKFGTPLEDALRRDLTINSLFYNINSQEVEDMTGNGLQDLKDGIIRTPLPPMQTLLDDPLRALRVVRFASRFQFRLDPELWKAIQHPDVHFNLKFKVSRERISQEAVSMLSHPSKSTDAVILLYNLNLLPLVLSVPFEEVENIIIPDPRRRVENQSKNFNDEFMPILYHTKGVNLYMVMKLFLQHQSNKSHVKLVFGDDFESIEANSILRYAALMDHGRDVVYRYLLAQKKKPTFRPMLLTHYICQHQLFAGKKSTDSVCLLQRGADMLLKQLLHENYSVPVSNKMLALDGLGVPSFGTFNRVDLGLQLREWGGEFPSILLLTCAKLSLDDFISRIEDSELVNIGLEETISRHAVAVNIAQSFLQQQLHQSQEIKSTCNKRKYSDEAESTLLSWMEQALLKGSQAGGRVLDAVSSLGLEEEWCRPLLLSGKELKRDVFSRIPNGPVFSEVVDKQTKYELCHPNISKSDLIEYMKSQYPQFI